MGSGDLSFWVKREKFELLFAASRLCYLIGGYTGSRSYGDVVQLVGTCKRSGQIPAAPLGIPVLEARNAAIYDELVEKHPSLVDNAPVLYYSDELLRKD